MGNLLNYFIGLLIFNNKTWEQNYQVKVYRLSLLFCMPRAIRKPYKFQKISISK